MKTIKQIADELGISKQKVYRFINQNSISEAHQSKSVKQYDEVAENLIKQHFLKNDSVSKAHHEAHQVVSNEAIIEALLKQLETKDNEIKRLHSLLEREQQIRMVEAQQKLLPSKWKFWKNKNSVTPLDSL